MPEEYYYSANPQCEHKYATVELNYRGQSLQFLTDSGVFSRTELDDGSKLLMDALPQELTGSFLDMGCGWGAIGISVAKVHPALQVTMVDINQRACELSRRNADTNQVKVQVLEGDGFSAVAGEKYDLIAQNPPIRTGKAVIYQMFADASEALCESGKLYLVIRKQQGAPSAQKYLSTLFQQVELPLKKGGYWIFCCSCPIRRTSNDL